MADGVRTAVIGGGAMGGALAADAVGAGQDVVLVDVSADLVRHLSEHGLTVEGPQGTENVTVAATTDPGEAGEVDLAVVFVKGHHTPSAARTVAGLLGPDTVVLTLQNGWGNADELARVLPPERLVMGVTYHSCTAAGPGHVRHTGRGPTLVGPYLADGPVDPAQRAAAVLTAAGWEAVATCAVRTEIWKKLVLNAATLPTAALARLPAGEVGRPGPLLDLVDALAAEAVAVARAQRLDIELDERVARIHAVLEAAGSGKASMLQDVEATRKTEIETVNGAVARMGAELGVPTPLNTAMAALVGGLERSWRL
jgi:2-dehydropantoate 2-reductase